MWAVALAFLLGALGTAAPSAAAPAAQLPLQHLSPGKHLDAHQEVPITVVFVGLQPGQNPTGIDADRLLATQPQSQRVVDRTTRFFEQNGTLGSKLEPSAIGLTYDYRYRTVFADQAFEDAFFGYLSQVAFGPVQPTIFQQAYSANPLAAQNVNYDFLINASGAERWLADHAGPMLGVDTTRPTVFFINWFGRPDFRFHTYAFLGTRPGWPFPTGLTFIGQMQAFGGSPPDGPYGGIGRLSRLWFYDLSAGPDYGTASWVLDQADFDGDGVPEERIPPIWEYGTSHWYRPFDDLTADLAKVTRYVAVDSMFGQSPIYDPAISEPLLPDQVQLDLNLFAGVQGRDPRSTLDAGAVPQSLARLDPTRTFSTDAEVDPLSGLLDRVYDCQQSSFGPSPESCYGNRTDLGPFYPLDHYFSDHGNQFLDGTRYEVPIALFDVPDERLSPNAPRGLASLGPANVQRWNYVWNTDRLRFEGIDTTGAVTHEVGHHLGLSHVHDGFDSLSDSGFMPTGPFFFAFVGDESHTGMSYLPNTNEFGQFDRDNMARWQLAARLDNANRILGDVVKSPRAGRASAEIATADGRAGDALDALHAWDLAGASSDAADAYHAVLAAAARAGVQVEPWSGVADETPGAGVLAAATEPRELKPPTPPGFSAGLERIPLPPGRAGSGQ
jgi:hypothetical protein